MRRENGEDGEGKQEWRETREEEIQVKYIDLHVPNINSLVLSLKS